MFGHEPLFVVFVIMAICFESVGVGLLDSVLVLCVSFIMFVCFELCRGYMVFLLIQNMFVCVVCDCKFKYVSGCFLFFCFLVFFLSPSRFSFLYTTETLVCSI